MGIFVCWGEEERHDGKETGALEQKKIGECRVKEPYGTEMSGSEFPFGLVAAARWCAGFPPALHENQCTYRLAIAQSTKQRQKFAICHKMRLGGAQIWFYRLLIDTFAIEDTIDPYTKHAVLQV